MVKFVEKCPICKIGKLAEVVEKKFLSKKIFYICNNNDCSAKFLERGNTAKLLSCKDNTFLERYGDYLEKREWINIANGGLSDKEIEIQKEEKQRVVMVVLVLELRKGSLFRVGKFGATGESYMERRHIDTGNVFITNKRFVFVGSSKSIDFLLTKVLSVEPFSDGISISRSNKQKTEYFVGFDGLMIEAVIEGAIKNL